MEIRLLGAVECVVRGAVVRLSRFQERCLVAVLAAEAGRIVTLDRLVALLWDEEPPARARSIVQTHVSRLRSRLAAAGADAELLTRGQGYLLDIAPEAVDAQQFRRLVEQARATADPAARAEGLQTALAMWRGPALADAATRRVADQVCAGLEELRLGAVEDRADADLATGRHRELLTELTDLVARHPLRERLVGLLMLAHYRSGQQAKALEVYREARRRLTAGLGIEPGAELRHLERAILNQDRTLDVHPAAGQSGRDPGVWRGQRSHLTSIVGREPEIAELTWLLNDHRLVTVVGPGGVGKTTLAIHAAETSSATSGNDVTVVSLTSLRTRDEIVWAVGSLLGVVGTTVDEALAAVTAALAARPQLLVLDNCEHLTAACADVVRRLLSVAPRLVVLATSREPVGLPEETVWRLEPLRTPTDDTATDPTVPAVALFLRRARERCAGFAPTAADMRTIGRICRRVDGLPLALELAASRLRTLSVAQLADQFAEGVAPPQPGRSPAAAAPRHETVAATIDWSYRLLTAAEQRLLRRIAVFRASFTAAAAQQVCGTDPLSADLVPEILAGLVDRSLLRAVDLDGQRRYQLLQVVRDYADDRLADAGERRETAHRHLAYLRERASAIVAAPTIEEQMVGWGAFGPEIDDLRAALRHGYATDRVAAIELTTLTFDFWQVHGAHMAEGDAWIAEAWPYLDECPPELRCLLRTHKAELEVIRDNVLDGMRLYQQALPGLRAYHPALYTDALSGLVRDQVWLLDPAALPHARDVYAQLRTSPEKYIRVLALATLVEALLTWGRYDEAAEVCERDAADPGDLAPTGAVRWHTTHCLVELARGRFDHAEALLGQLREAMHRPGNFMHLATPAQAIALHALCALPAPAAATVLADIATQVADRYPPSLSKAYRFTILQAEADRRTGDPDRGRSRLAEVLTTVLDGAPVTNYSDLMPAVVVAALIAADLGETRASRDLAGAWDRVRRPLGLPAMLGFAAPVADVLGLDPAAGPPDPAYTWDEPTLRGLVEQARQWCACGAPVTGNRGPTTTELREGARA